MKRTAFVLLGTVLLLALFVLQGSPASAASGVCVSSPGSGPLGSVFTVTCSGFFPNEGITYWLTEPDGHAYAGLNNFINASTSHRADSAGNASVTVFTRRSDGAAIALGEWAVTIKGAANIGIGRFTVTGGTEGVSGATLTANADGFVIGSGFMPGEIVTIWFDYPNGDCSGEWKLGTYLGGPGLSTSPWGNRKADSAGMIAFNFGSSLFASECDGTYHIVARGNSSGAGGETWWTTGNNPVATNAVLTANPSSVVARGGLISFSGFGFNSNSAVTCWETSPQGQALSIGPYMTGSGGTLGFSIVTGSNYDPLYRSSEGALGRWAVTCRDGSGNTAIAWFWVYGAMVDP